MLLEAFPCTFTTLEVKECSELQTGDGDGVPRCLVAL